MRRVAEMEDVIEVLDGPIRAIEIDHLTVFAAFHELFSEGCEVAYHIDIGLGAFEVVSNIFDGLNVFLSAGGAGTSTTTATRTWGQLQHERLVSEGLQHKVGLED